MTMTYICHPAGELIAEAPDKHREQKQLPLSYMTNSVYISRVKPEMAEDL